MNKNNLSLKVDGYTITIYREPEETEEMKQNEWLYVKCERANEQNRLLNIF